MRILLVEDDPLLAGFMEEALAFAGHQVKIARTGAAALRTFHDDFPRSELLVSEAVLPDMQGWEVVRTCRTAVPGFPAVIVSDRPARHFRIEPFAVILQKPFDDDALQAAIGAALGDPSP